MAGTCVLLSLLRRVAWKPLTETPKMDLSGTIPNCQDPWKLFASHSHLLPLALPGLLGSAGLNNLVALSSFSVCNFNIFSVKPCVWEFPCQKGRWTPAKEKGISLFNEHHNNLFTGILTISAKAGVILIPVSTLLNVLGVAYLSSSLSMLYYSRCDQWSCSGTSPLL